MDLISAQVEAANSSRLKQKKVYIILKEDGEFTVSVAPIGEIYATYVNGGKVEPEPVSTPSPTPSKKSTRGETSPAPIKPETTNKTKAMAKVEKAKPAKKAAKKVAKPAAKKSETKAAPKGESKNVVREGLIFKCPALYLTKEQWSKLDAHIEKNDTTLRKCLTEAMVATYKL